MQNIECSYALTLGTINTRLSVAAGRLIRESECPLDTVRELSDGCISSWHCKTQTDEKKVFYIKDTMNDNYLLIICDMDRTTDTITHIFFTTVNSLKDIFEEVLVCMG